MKFRAEHVFSGISLPDFEALFYDEPFGIALCAAVKLGRQVVRLENRDGRLVRSLRVTPERTLPSPVAKIVGGSRIEYTEHTEYVWGTYRADWRVEPSILPDKIESRGRLGFEQCGDGVMRWVEGEVKVRMFGLGGIIEHFIIGDTEKSYDAAADFTRSWIAKHGTKLGKG
ncbi:MAG TPA: DUF2505 domain-containing protein [Polyangia bacterium]|jgi:hypothetical protein